MKKTLSDAWEQDDKLTVFGYGKKAAAIEIFKALDDDSYGDDDTDLLISRADWMRIKKKFGVD